jgi:hypothetical protein
MPIPYTWSCTALIKAGTPLYTEVNATCIEDPARGAESSIQRVYPILINSVLVSDVPIDFVVRIKKEGIDGIIRPLADSIPASMISRLISVSGQLPSVFYVEGEPASIYIDSMEKVYINVVNLATPDRDTTVRFQIVAEKG